MSFRKGFSQQNRKGERVKDWWWNLQSCRSIIVVRLKIKARIFLFFFLIFLPLLQLLIAGETFFRFVWKREIQKIAKRTKTFCSSFPSNGRPLSIFLSWRSLISEFLKNDLISDKKCDLQASDKLSSEKSTQR